MDSGFGVVHLRAGGVSVVLDCRGPGIPSMVHWGADLGELGAGELDDLVLASLPTAVVSSIATPVPASLVPDYASGWLGTPGLAGHRDGQHFSPYFRLVDVVVDTAGASGSCAGGTVTVTARDDVARLGLTVLVELTAEGLLRGYAEVSNAGDDAYTVDWLALALPVPQEAAELLDLTGYHCAERIPQRHGFTHGVHAREGRRGRTGADATLVLVAGVPGFGFRAGELWSVHVAWGGNHRTYAERMNDGSGVLGGGELLLPGEVRLPPGEVYRTPWIFGSYGQGLDEMSRRFHRWLRSRPQHPSSPRPVHLNTWEAVYFDHDLDKLLPLADAAAQVGVERFVLDDGWFRGRRHDRAGLGDWYVDEQVWPDGLHPLVDRVTGLGMQFGLWVEPEMVNPDSDLARAHPDWILGTGGRIPPASRHQQVLNLAIPEAYDYILGRLDALLDEYDIGYLKWDHNRDLVDAGDQHRGTAGVHAQTMAVYRLLEEVKRRHPDVEIESCSSGGARVDLGVLQHTDRVWASDSNDALQRQHIQRWTQLLLPGELIGAHVGPPTCHSSGRTQSLSFRASTALFGHFGIEWDIASASESERAELAAWVAFYKEQRDLLHSGSVVRADRADDEVMVHGIVAPDGRRALFAVVQLTYGRVGRTGRVRLPGLSAGRRYRIQAVLPGSPPPPMPWSADGRPVTLTGAALANAGIQIPRQHPEQAVLLQVSAGDEAAR